MGTSPRCLSASLALSHIAASPSPSHYRQHIAAAALSLPPTMAIVDASPAAPLPQSPVAARGTLEPDADSDGEAVDNVVVVIPPVASPWSAAGRGAVPASSPMVRARAWTATSPSPAQPFADEAGTPAAASCGWSPASSADADDETEASAATPAPTHVAVDSPAPTAGACADDADDTGCDTPAPSAAAKPREDAGDAGCAPAPPARRWRCSVM